jgi:antitoxin component YwqK of YwqJK toxin-antitoxin module
MLIRSLLTLTCLLVSCATHAAILDCDIGGQAVNPNNGSTYAGKTGIMKCVDRETRKFVREEEYRDGRAIGHRKSIDFEGNTGVGTYNANGNRDGEYKQFAPDGTLLSEERYANGDSIGLQTSYYKNRQVRRRAFAQPGKGTLASLEYNERGQLMRLQCADKPLLGDDRGLCGFDGRIADVTLHNARGDFVAKARYENGKRVSLTEFGAQGSVSRSDEIQGQRRITRQHFPEGPLRLEIVTVAQFKESERELAKSGQPIRVTRWQEGRMIEETLWYLNGQQKSKTHWERDGDQVRVKGEEFWDTGKIRARTVTDERRASIGVQQTYNDAGVLESELTYDKGALTRRRNYKDGKLVLEEEYFEDGSRKAVR